jgi:DNA-3-methyladenine glycosylase
MATMKLVPRTFYQYNTINIAEALLGKFLVRKTGEQKLVGRIVEVEAYIGEDDPACHASHGLTPRTRILYGPPGNAYVYFTYGMYFMLNVVTEREGFPAAILIRAVEPISGFDGDDQRPASGPGKLCRSMQIDRSLNGMSFRSSELRIMENEMSLVTEEIRWTPRIGISSGQDKLWRAYLHGNPFVSGKSFKFQVSSFQRS